MAVAPKRLQGLVGASVLIAVLLCGAVTLAAGWPSVGAPDPSAEILYRDIPAGVSETVVAGYSVLLVRDGDEVTAMSPVAFDVDQVIWCPDDQRFVSEAFAAVFARDGTRLQGPGPSLRRLRVVREADGVVVYARGEDLLPIDLRTRRGDGDSDICSTAVR